MKISPIRRNNFINFKSKVETICRGRVSSELEKKIDEFEETRKGAKWLGSGLFANAYILDGTKCVLKESLPSELARKQNQDFWPEANALAMLPPSIQNSQKLIALVETEKGNYYLLSTFVEGAPASYPENPWNKNSFDGLFETLFSLDKEGIYHNDINEANCLIDSQHRAKTIDYQFAQKFNVVDADNARKFKTNKKMMPSNAQMFEMASLPWYIKEMAETAPKSEIRKLFKTYLESKAQYAKQRAMYLNNIPNAKDMARYELLQAKFFENPTNEMIDLQAKKLQLLYSYRRSFSVADANNNKNKNIGSAIQSYIYALAAAKDMENYANYLARESEDEPLLKTFCEYEAQYARFWYDSLENDLALEGKHGVYPWIERNVQLNPREKREIITQYDEEGSWTSLYTYVPPEEDLSKNFEAAEHILPEPIVDIAGLIIEENAKEIRHSFNNSEASALKSLSMDLKKQLIRDDNSIRPNTIDNDVIDYLIKKQKYVGASKDVIGHIEEEGFNAVIASAVIAQYQKNLAEKSLSDLMKNVDLGEVFVAKQKEVLKGDFNLDILKKSAKMLVKYIAETTGEEALESKKFLRFV